ncbi:MAG: hypothetical protein REJ24_20065 [Rhodocyclaceae bacterium]|nr:hypothetical protein [Rhodocyclaceae bacterium]MDQ8002772.1 hypothetical protein [Pseudomonadota bacterium]MDQ8016153.1 hypothetical protein [Pseudomonadota bacterium]
MATRFVPFDPGTITDANIRNVDFVRGKFNEAVQAVAVRDTEIQRLGDTNTELQKQLATATQTVVSRDAELGGLRKELAGQAERNVRLAAELEQLKNQTAKIGIQDLVSQVKLGIDRVNTEVIAKKAPGMLVEGVEVEVRGGIDVKDGLQITQLPASALAEHSVSVLRFQLRPSSPLKIVDESDDRA